MSDMGVIEEVNLEDVEDIDEDLDLGDFGDVDIDIDVPHIRVDTKEFRRFLGIAKNVISDSGRDIVSKSICMNVEDDVLMMRATDFDVYLEYSIGIENEENILDDEIVLSLNAMEQLIKAAPSKIIIYEEDDEYKVRLIGGVFPLKTYNMGIDKFEFVDKLEKVTDVSSTDMYEVIDSFKGPASSAVAPTERRIYCDSQGSYVNYMWSILISDYVFTDMDIKVKDIKVLQNLIKDVDDDLIIYKTKDSKVDRMVISGDNFKYAFIISDIKIPKTVKDNIDNVLLDEGVFVDFNQLYKMVDLSANISYSVGKIDINYTNDGRLKIIIKTKTKNDAEIEASGSVVGDVKPLDEDLTFQASLLRVLLKAFNSNTVKISLSKDGLGITNDKFKAAIYSSIM